MFPTVGFRKSPESFPAAFTVAKRISLSGKTANNHPL